MNRVTIEMLDEAFKNSNIIPTAKRYGFINEEGKACGCAFTALFCSNAKADGAMYIKGLKESESAAILDIAIADTFDKIYNPSYIRGFMEGFDYDLSINAEERIKKLVNCGFSSSSEMNYTGIKDGLAARDHFLIKK